ncbi:HEPN domain-containing protein [Aeromonas dhakensis]|uniref:HEPN domain-containing protein n=1 Tax=Aeromonas dhakensis TaxID=196024 RepID=UPI00036DA420|nr:HEPN domain-containing protein [Aeromonas dhakensis]
MKVEYLILIDSEEPFCQSIASLNSLIQAYDQVSIESDKILFSGCSFGYEVAFDNIGKGYQRYFHLKLTSENDSESEKFREFLKLLRTILSKISGRPPEILFDEMASDFCTKAYPKIHYTENLLRKLITTFMFTNVGIKWTKEAVPKEVEESIKNKQSDKVQNFLHELDFIQLSNLLFKEYATGDIRKVTEKISSANTIHDLNIGELKDLVPASNWQRYFESIVDCESAYLKKRWDRLYDLRCKVAHNRFITIDELNEINKLTSEVNEKFDKALDNLDKVEVTEEQKDEVAVSVAVNANDLFADFIQKWGEVNEALRSLNEVVADSDEEREKIKGHSNWRNQVNFAIKKKALDKSFKKTLTDLSQFRNAIVHNPDVMFPKSTIYEQMALMDEIIDGLFENRESILISLVRMRDGV